MASQQWRTKTSFFCDPWLPRPTSFKLIFPVWEGIDRLRDLILESGAWDMAKIDECSFCWALIPNKFRTMILN